MERKGDLRDGEDGLIGGKLQASLRFLPPLTFLNTLLIVFPAQRPFKTVTGFCSRLIVVPVNNLHPDNDLQVSLLCYLCIRKKYNITLTVELFLIMTFHALSLFSVLGCTSARVVLLEDYLVGVAWSLGSFGCYLK